MEPRTLRPTTGGTFDIDIVQSMSCRLLIVKTFNAEVGDVTRSNVIIIIQADENFRFVLIEIKTVQLILHENKPRVFLQQISTSKYVININRHQR
jgi:hypothetical protein